MQQAAKAPRLAAAAIAQSGNPRAANMNCRKCPQGAYNAQARLTIAAVADLSLTGTTTTVCGLDAALIQCGRLL